MKIPRSLLCVGSALFIGSTLLSGAELVVGGISAHFESVDPKFSRPVEFEVSLIFSDAGKKILNFNSTESKLEKVVDSTGKDLTAKSEFSFFSNAPKNNLRREMKVVTKNDTPAKDASWVHLKGTALFDVASKTEEMLTEELDLTKGTKFEINGQEFEIVKAEKPKWGDAKWEVTIKSAQSFTRVEKWELEVADGKTMGIEKGGASWSSGFGKTTHTLGLQLEEKVEKGKLKLTVYSDFETIEVPVDLTASMGR